MRSIISYPLPGLEVSSRCNPWCQDRQASLIDLLLSMRFICIRCRGRKAQNSIRTRWSKLEAPAMTTVISPWIKTEQARPSPSSHTTLKSMTGSLSSLRAATDSFYSLHATKSRINCLQLVLEKIHLFATTYQ